MSSTHFALSPAPAIRISRASPDTGECEDYGQGQGKLSKARTRAPRRTKSLPAAAHKKKVGSQSDIKRSATTANSTERTTTPGMPSSSPQDGPSSPPGQYRSQSSTKKARIGSNDVDWAGITDPEERRRIQNRIAQRKFREKARDNKERSERDSRNQEHARNSYRVPVPGDIDTAPDLSGLPWGSMNLNHFVLRGHDAESRRSGSGHGTTYVSDEGYTVGTYSSAYGQGHAQSASFGSSGAGGDGYYDQAPYIYDSRGL